MCSAGHLFYCHETSFQIFEQYDHWPVGWGFLYNQQLTHNGEAHTDPDAPDRVQLIMTFTPRPRYGEKELETRSVSEGGADFVSIECCRSNLLYGYMLTELSFLFAELVGSVGPLLG